MSAEQTVFVEAETLPRAGEKRFGSTSGGCVKRRNLGLGADGSEIKQGMLVGDAP